jgi:hypothetical protein
MTRQPDPWEDDKFSPLDTRTGPEHFAAELAAIANEDPENFPPPEDTPPTVIAPSAEPTAPTFAPPDVVEMEDGSSVKTYEDAEGWHAEVNPGNGRTLQVFHARSDRDLLKQLAVAQANATKKINQQEKQIKLSRKAEPEPKVENSGQLTADQLFEIKTIAQSDFVGAFNKMLEYAGGPGVTFAQFVKWMRVGQENETKAENAKIAARFFKARPGYVVSKANEEKMLEHIAQHYNKEFTVENLIDAFDELTEAGLLPDVAKPRPVAPVIQQPEPVAAVIPAAPVLAAPPAQPANARIERPAGRANATLGLRVSETTTVRPPTTREVPSAEEMENMTDAEIEQLFASVVRTKAQSARR